MERIKLSALEQEMQSFDFAAFQENDLATAQRKIAAAQSVEEVKSEICNIWSKIRKYVKWAEAVPGAGKFVTLFVQLMDGICGAPK